MNENKNKKVSPKVGGISMQWKQSDLIDFVIDKEVEKLKTQMQELIDQRQQKETEKKEYEKTLNVSKMAQDFYKNIIKSFQKMHGEDLTFQISATNTLSEMSNDEIDRLIAKKMDSMGGGYFHPMMGGFGGLHNLVYSIIQSMKEEHHYYDHGNKAFSKFNVLHVYHDKNFVASLKYNIPDKEFDKIKNKLKVFRDEIDKLNNDIDVVEQHIYDVQNSSRKVKNNLIEQYLTSTEDGKQMLAKLSKIKFDATKMIS